MDICIFMMWHPVNCFDIALYYFCSDAMSPQLSDTNYEEYCFKPIVSRHQIIFL